MAGKRHHYVWQMLQRGFAKQEYGQHHIWVYRKNSLCSRTTTKKFGVEKEFYGSEGSEADENITQFENKIQSFIRETRSADDGAKLDSATSAALVAHLEMRSKFLRNEASFSIQRMMILFKSFFLSRERTTELLRSYLKSHPEFIKDISRDSQIPADMVEIVEEYFAHREAFFLQHAATEVLENALRMTNQFMSLISDLVLTSHNKVLEQEFTSLERARLHEKMTYNVIQTKTPSFLLPDTCLAFFKRQACSPYSDKNDDIEGVFIPISSNTGILGRHDRHFSRPIDTLNKALASCAYEAFIFSDRHNDLLRLSARIGKNAKLVSEGEIKKIIRSEVFESL